MFYKPYLQTLDLSGLDLDVGLLLRHVRLQGQLLPHQLLYVLADHVQLGVAIRRVIVLLQVSDVKGERNTVVWKWVY